MRQQMPLAKLKEKRQITLPVDICNQIHADKGDIFNFEVDGGKIVMTLQKLVPASEEKPRTKGVDISKYIGIAKGTFGSVEKIDEYIRNERATWD
jgi:bifunctional DNA-binding transcriptional regulator/antitoxin component of YhaV-PrlF toxin-antitoxin module